MKIVIDANVIFSIFIKNSTNAELFFNKNLELYAPEFIFEEIMKYTSDILSKTHRTNKDFEDILMSLKEFVTFVDDDELMEYIDQAEKISPDPKDVTYFALAMKLKIPFWSNDKKLKNQSEVKIYSTSDLIKTLD
ncbi:hypothetical protein COU57_05345 [Candidatus Pacearchaeota archaeon CG10_big_fil_rev_8_21_14_0_10_32_14]|nr:MAG: hypothetical protein COU57_05345 [Candidatus Pacearchaeota archaeon CG10_big_fil_rev_8_21_14_0_10_32_14]